MPPLAEIHAALARVFDPAAPAEEKASIGAPVPAVRWHCLTIVCPERALEELKSRAEARSLAFHLLQSK